MWDFIGKALDKLLEAVGGILDAVIEFLLKGLLAPNIAGNAEAGISIYNGLIGNAVKMLTTNPMEWNQEGWKLIAEEVYPVFLLVACPLVAIFWMIGLCAESIDPKMHGDIRPEALLLSFFKLSIAEFVTVYALHIICALFSFVDVLTGGWVGENAKIPASLGFTLAEAEALPGLILALTYLLSLVYMAVLIFVSCIILYTATVRFFKILALIPFGTLASSTIAGGRELSRTAMHFWKYILSIILEAVAMMLMLALFSRVQGSLAIVSLDGDMRIVGILLNRILLAFLCLGSVKGAGNLLQRGLGV